MRSKEKKIKNKLKFFMKLNFCSCCKYNKSGISLNMKYQRLKFISKARNYFVD